MIEQKTIIAFYEQGHERLDELFKTFQKFVSFPVKETLPKENFWL